MKKEYKLIYNFKDNDVWDLDVSLNAEQINFMLQALESSGFEGEIERPSKPMLKRTVGELKSIEIIF
ncbi:hypothetical protein [Paenisporosarcina sp. NPDC076898]|uniref:hypothetical protein n=1 Tax=unclassified Paenisporosarcina TaxID=2642018 RepID=UPI003CFFC8FF